VKSRVGLWRHQRFYSHWQKYRGLQKLQQQLLPLGVQHGLAARNVSYASLCGSVPIFDGMPAEPHKSKSAGLQQSALGAAKTW